MSRSVKIKARPGQTVRFPAVCVHCGRPAKEQMTLSHQEGRITRLLAAPLCAECAQLASRLSASEQRLEQIGWLAAGFAALLVLTAVLLLLPAVFPVLVQFATGLALAAVAGMAVKVYFGRRRRRAAPAAKQAVRDAARLTHFSWRTITLTFANQAVAQDFVELNQADLMEI